jgi:hypothetical protein
MDDRKGGYDPLAESGARLSVRRLKADLYGIETRDASFGELRSALEDLSCLVELVRPGPGALVLRVRYPGRLLNSDDILCTWIDGELWFTWADGRTISPAEDHSGAAIAIYRALRKGPLSS